jgi:selenocysteine-specific translation elongation factor
MKSINFVLLGDHSIASQLGKKGTTTDISIYDRKTADAVFTWTVPITFPEKIQSLMQAVNIAEYAILNVSVLDRFLGEQVIALDYAGIASGFVLHSFSVDRDKLVSMLKSTLIAGYDLVDSVEDLRAVMLKLEPKVDQGPLVIAVDHAFDVKGVGTVVLGVIKSGTVKTYDELVLTPSMKPLLVKSIQMHDDPVQSSSCPSRVGLAVKGVSAEEISRGDIICHAGSTAVTSGNCFTTRFTKSPFFKGEILDSQMYVMSLGMQIRAVKVRNEAGTGELQITSDKPVSYKDGQACVLLKPDSQGTRIIGKGQILQ